VKYSDDWWAGFLAGEGSVGVGGGDLPWHGSPQIQLSNCCLPLVEAFAKRFGAPKIYAKALRPRCRQVWAAAARGVEVPSILAGLGPMGPEKDPQVQLLRSWLDAVGDREARAEIRWALADAKQLQWPA
jgi:hypothetical protein